MKRDENTQKSHLAYRTDVNYNKDETNLLCVYKSDFKI